MLSTFCCLLLAFAQDPVPPPVAQQEGYRLTTKAIDSREEGDAMVYRIEEITLQGPDLQLRADSVTIWFDAAEYRKLVGLNKDEPAEESDAAEDIEINPNAEQNPAPITKGDDTFFGGLWSRRILTELGLPEDDKLIREIRLDGHVVIAAEGLLMQCDRLQDWPAEGRSEATSAVLDFPPGAGGPNGWPMRLSAVSIQEHSDGSLHAIDTTMSTCLERPPHYSVFFGELIATRIDEQSFVWRPSEGWFQVLGVPLLPVPTPDFSPGDNFLGFRGITFDSSRSLGNTVTPRFGGLLKSDDGRFNIDWNFTPAYSERRGFPLRLFAEATGPNYTGYLDIFHLDDGAFDKHSLSASLGRDSDTRQRIRWHNRWRFPDAWRLDANLAYTTDPLVDPEFFRREWERNDDAESRLFLRRGGENSFFAADATYRLDDVGYTPIEGLGRSPDAAEQSLDVLPRLSYDAYSSGLFEIPTGFLGGNSGKSPLNFEWGSDVGILQLRDRDLVSARRSDFGTLPEISRTRARLWAETALPMNSGGFFFRPGFRLSGSLWQDDTAGADQDEQLHTETFFETGIVLEKRYDDGWRHKVLPQLRLRKRTANREATGVLLDFDGNDIVVDGEVAEMSLRQFFYAPGETSPWLDVNMLVPWYTDGTDLLESPITPFPRAQHGAGIGPTELRVVWTPGRYGETLRGVRWDARVRHDFEVAETEEIFTRLMIKPNSSLYYGASYFETNRTSKDAALGSVFGGLRFTEQWGVGFKQSVNFDGNAGLRSGFATQYYGHDFLFEVGYTKIQFTGETGFYFNLSPRFFMDSYGSRDLAKLRFN